MAYAQSFDARPRRRMALALLATTALAALLGGCTQTGLPFAQERGEQAFRHRRDRRHRPMVRRL